jgi:CRP/FNR family transcriptional regulator
LRADHLERVLRHALFQNVETERMRPLLEPLRLREYGAGEIVTEPSLRRAGLSIVLSGRLQVFDVTSGGRRVILDYVEPGGVDGFLAVSGLQSHFTQALVPSDVVGVGRDVLERMLLAEPRLAVNLLWFMSRRLRRREDQVTRMTLRDPSQRLAAQLLSLAEAEDDAGPAAAEAQCPRLSHDALADLVGLRRETVTLHLSRLRRLGAVHVESGRFRFDVRMLEAVRDGETPPARRVPRPA